MAPWQLIVLLGAFAAVAALAMPRRKDAAEPAASVAGMQVALEQFMENMEADNRELVETITKSQHQTREDNASRDERIAVLERRCKELEDKLGRAELRLEEQLQALRAAALQSVVKEREPAEQQSAAEAAAVAGLVEAEPSSPPIRQRYAELFDLHGQGKSIDVIAKKLGINKGEVMLILQLAKQEEERRV
jgi:DNA-binding NarL/FixJ family response regulator